jgi:nitrate/TMAO reductase-like tetraheme cytochrome c subunit
MTAHLDDTDRFCSVCHGARVLPDTSTHDYAYNARSLTPCWACHVPADPEPQGLGPDDLMDAAIAKLAAANGMTIAAYRAMDHAENNTPSWWS